MNMYMKRIPINYKLVMLPYVLVTEQLFTDIFNILNENLIRLKKEMLRRSILVPTRIAEKLSVVKRKVPALVSCHHEKKRFNA